MNQPIQRIFVGWSQPLLHSVRDYLRSRLGDRRDGRTDVPDYSGFTVVLPGARAGRRLLELLAVDEATGGGSAGAIVPPRVLTPGVWISLAAMGELPEASEMTRLAAWVWALGSLDDDSRNEIVRTGQVDADGIGSQANMPQLLGVARTIDGCHAELCAAGVRFRDVATHGAHTSDFVDGPRWAALAQVQEAYEHALKRAGLSDAGLNAVNMLDHGAARDALDASAGELVLAGIAELNVVARRLLHTRAGRTVAMVAAPESLAHRFDDCGCVLPAAWEGAELPLHDESIIACEGPAEQAAAALQVLEKWAARGPALAPDQVTIGVPDEEVEDRLVRLAGRLGNVPVRRAEGDPIAYTRPVKLLLAIADYVEDADFAALAALARHPDVEHWIRTVRVAENLPPVEVWLGILDEYQQQHLHGRLEIDWLTDDERTRGVLEVLRAGVDGLLGENLLRTSAGAPALACSCAWDVLRAVYSGAGLTIDPATHEACLVLQKHLAELAAVSPPLCDALLLTPAETIRLVIQQAVGDSIPESNERAAIDLVGWLEIAADDAPHLIITGMNEGVAPEAPGVDPLLPEGLRRTLKLRDRSARLARDSYLVGIAAASRAQGDTAFIFGRRTAEGDPLAPSRLLLACEHDELLRRVQKWLGDDKTGAARAPLMIQHADRSRFASTPGILATKPIEEMSVTSFKKYIDSPLGFYLQQVLRLEEVGDEEIELDALGFGNLLHEVLRKLTATEIVGSRDAATIAAFLSSTLEAVARQQFGTDPRPEVALQIEQARARLSVFAQLQAERTREGWRVLHTEWAPAARAAFLQVDGRPMYLRGRIDRIDVHSDGRWAVLDYKTGNSAPEARLAFTKRGEWRDPQLPLYRHLARSLGLSGEPSLWWIALPRSTDEVSFIEAKWTPDELAAADEAAAEVVRAVRRQEFGDPGRRPPADGIIGLLCGGVQTEEEEA